MKLAQFNYELPPSAIAQEPADPRDSARLMCLSISSGTLSHQHFRDLPNFLKKGDVVVINQTRVFPARLRGRKTSGGKIEILLLAPFEKEPLGSTTSRWKALVRGATQPVSLRFPDDLRASMEARSANGEWVLRFSVPDIGPFLEKHGEMPLPPYIKRDVLRDEDKTRYQTIFAKENGAVAAPTAGFHFTDDVFKRLKELGVGVLTITLHVGWGTFRPVRVEEIERHTMLPETFVVSEETARQLNQTRAAGGRIVGVGTTVVRTLESVCSNEGVFHAAEGETNLYIWPGYPFHAVDVLLTNFHLPDSTPLLLACAFAAHKSGHWTASEDPFTLRQAYEEAMKNNYRFYSYGDAMLIQ